MRSTATTLVNTSYTPATPNYCTPLLVYLRHNTNIFRFSSNEMSSPLLYRHKQPTEVLLGTNRIEDSFQGGLWEHF